MKKIILNILVIALFIITLCSLAVSDTEAPPPFASIKEICIKNIVVDTNGRYISNPKLLINGIETLFILAYLPDTKVIAIGMVKDKILGVVEYHEDTNIFTFYMTDGIRASRQDIPSDQAIKIAYDFFRKLVAGNII